MTANKTNNMLNKVVSGSEFARFLHVSRQNISEMGRNGALVRRPDGKYDLSNPVNQDYIRKHTERVKIISKQSRLNDELPTAGERNEQKKVLDTKTKDAALRVETLLGSTIDKSEAERLKTLEQIEDLRIKNQRHRGELINKQLVSKVFAQLYQIDVNGLKTLAASVSSAIAATAAIDDQTIVIEIEKIIDEEVLKILQRIQFSIKKFLFSVAEESAITDNLIINSATEGNFDYQ